MYEQFKNELVMKLAESQNFTDEQIAQMLICLDDASYNYDVKRKETQIVPFNQELPHLAKMFLVCKKVEGLSEGTLYNYNRCLRNFFYALQKAPEQVVANDVRVYLYKYQQERGISNRSLEKIRNCLCSFYGWMYAEEYIEKNPMISVRQIKYERKERKPVTQIELEYLRRACETPKQLAILEVLYSTGCRVGELIQMKKSDVDWREKTVHIIGKGKKHRTGFINAKAEVALREYLNSRKDDNEWLFVSDRKPHEQMHNDGIQKILRLMAKRASENVHNKVTPHVIRHTTATRMMENNADIGSIQAILGHDNINTTMVYVHRSMEQAKIEHRKAIV